MSPKNGWNPGQYMKFGGHRLRPAIDLLARIDSERPETVFDLGCGPGNATRLLAERWPQARITGVDNSAAMLAQAAEDLPGLQWVEADLNGWTPDRRGDVVFSNAALHWLDDHELLFPRLMENLNPGGVLILVEKVLGSDALLNRLWIKLYYDMKKRNGYSETEIAKKREALENVLIPYRPDENIKILARSGLDNVDMFFKWYNFAGFLGVKA